MNKLLVVVGLLAGVSAFADEQTAFYPDPGRDAAYNLCDAMSLSRKRDCVNFVGRARYFDEVAVPACAGFRFDHVQMDCLETVANKEYTRYEVDTCTNMRYDSSKMDCLRDSGRRYGTRPTPVPPGCTDTTYLKQQLEDARYAVRSGNDRMAMAILSDLIDSLR